MEQQKNGFRLSRGIRKMNNCISIIIPVFNAEQFVGDCLKSVLNQTHPDIQVIAVDDGSTDGSLQICEEIAARNEKVHVITQKNQGVSAARNAGLYAANGKYVVFVDSDDWIEPGLCSALLETAEKGDPDLVISGVSYFHSGEKSDFSSLPDAAADFLLEFFQPAFDELFRKGLINPPFNKLYKKSLIRRCFDKQVSLGEDLLFNLDYLKNCKTITTLPKSFYHYRIGRQNTLSSCYRNDGFDIALSQYYTVRRLKRSLWGSGCSDAPEAHKLIGDMCTSAENVVRKSTYSTGQIYAVLKRYFNQNAVHEIFASSVYRESIKYDIYKRLLRDRLFPLFYGFTTILAAFPKRG